MNRGLKQGRHAWLLLCSVVLLGWGVAGCRKDESACKPKCKKLLDCYQETRGKVADPEAAVARCTKICDGKGDSRFKKAVSQFGELSCLDFMKKYPREAAFLMKKGRGEPGKERPGRRVAKGEHPFPALQAKPPADPKKRRAWRSPVQSRVDKIVLKTPKDTIELVRVEPGKRAGDMGEWKLMKPKETKADRFAVRNLLNRLERMHVRGRAPIKPADFERQQLTEKTGVRAVLYAGDKVLADMIVGRADRAGKRGRGGITTLVRKSGTKDVWRVAGSLTYIFKRPASGWSDATVIRVEREDIARLEIQNAQGRLVLKRDPAEKDPRKRFSNWEIAESKPQLKSLDQNAVTRLVSVLTHLRATSFVKDPKPEETGLDKPLATVTLADKDGKKVSLLIGKQDRKRRIAFAKIKGDDRVFHVRYPLNELPEEQIVSFRDKTLVDADLNEVVGFSVEKAGAKVVFKKEGNQWKTVQPADMKVNLSRLISTVRLLEGRLSAHEFSKETDPAKTGLDKPRGKITVTVRPAPDKDKPKAQPKPERTVEILVGKPGPRGDFYVKVKGDKELYLVRKWVLNRVFRGPAEWSQQNRPMKPRGRRRPGGPGGRRGMMVPRRPMGGAVR